MNRRLQILALLMFALFSTASFYGQEQTSGPAQTRIQKEVRHEILMLPYFGVFDDIEYQVNGDTVTLLGSVTRPTLKSDAENVVKRIEGVNRVNNKIDVLPPSQWMTNFAWNYSMRSTAIRPWRSTRSAFKNQSGSLLRTGMSS